MKNASTAATAILAAGQYLRADLYTFTLVGGTVLRFTTADLPLVVSGAQYLSGLNIDRGSLRQAAGLEVSSLDLTITPQPDNAAGPVTVSGVPFLAGVRAGLFDGARVLWQKLFLTSWSDTTPGAVPWFQGRVNSARAGRVSAQLSLHSDLELLNVAMPRNILQSGCLHTLYDAGCQVVVGSFTSNGAVVSSGGNSVLAFATNLSQADGYFSLGRITFLSGPNFNVSRTVRRSLNASGVVELVSPLPSAPGVGDTFAIRAGCDKRQATCETKFANLARFRGYPYIPVPETLYDGGAVAGPAPAFGAQGSIIGGSEVSAKLFSSAEANAAPGDTTAPAQPAGITAVRSGGNVVVSWDPSQDPYVAPVGASGLKDYFVYRQGVYLAAVNSPAVGLSPIMVGSDVGTFTPAGSDSQNGAAHTLTGAGQEIYGTADQFRFKGAQVSGDCAITVQLTAWEFAAEAFAKAGIMFRGSLAAGAPFVHCLSFPFTQGAGVKVEYRATDNASATQIAPELNMTAPRWLRLVRAGNVFTGFYSLNGTAWISLGSVTVTLPTNAYVGLAVGSQLPGQSATCAFQNVTIQNLARVTYTDTSPPAGESVGYRVLARDVALNQSPVSATATVQNAFSPNFPRLGAYYISAPNWGNSANWAKLANLCHIIFTHYNGAEAAAGRSLRSTIDGIKALVPAGMGANPLHTAYIVHDETFDAGSGDGATARLRTKLAAENWYLRNPWPSGPIVESSFATNLDLINRTSGAGSSGGKTWVQWYVDLVYVQNVVGEAGNTANPSLDGQFLDNCYKGPRVNGDWNRDGTTDSISDTTFQTAERTGIKAHFDYVRIVWPGARCNTGNITDWPDTMGGALYGSSFTADYSGISPLLGVVDGGLSEYFIDNATINGEPGASKEYQERSNGLVGFYATRNTATYFQGAVRFPAMNIFSIRDITADGSGADNQRLRFGAAFVTTCTDGAVDDRHILDWSTLPAIYTGGSGGSGIGWLGQAVQTARTAPYSGNVYVREFVGGFSAVNPRNNGSQNFTLGVNVVRVDTGTTYTAGTNIPIADRDGLFLRKV